MPPSHNRRKRTRNEREKNDRAKRVGGGPHLSIQVAMPTRQNQWSQNEELDRPTYQGGPFPIIKLGHSGLTNTTIYTP